MQNVLLLVGKLCKLKLLDKKEVVKLEGNIKELMRNLDYVSAGILSNRVCKDTLKFMFRVS